MSLHPVYMDTAVKATTDICFLRENTKRFVSQFIDKRRKSYAQALRTETPQYT